MHARRAPRLPTGLALAAVCAALLIAVACSTSSLDDADATTTTADTTTTTRPTTTTTTSPPTTDTAPGATVAPPGPTTATPPQPGEPCALGSFPDCIDPELDGQGVYLVGGAACMEAFPNNPGLCADLDGDGHAGYPDTG
jgi:hypothetical protein